MVVGRQADREQITWRHLTYPKPMHIPSLRIERKMTKRRKHPIGISASMALAPFS